MANRTEWELAADASKLLKELDSVTGALKGLKKGTDTAEKGLADFQAAEEAVAQAAEEAEESFNNLMEGVESFGEAAGEVDSILAGMAGSLEMFDELAGTDFSEVAATAVEFAAGIESVSRAISMASPQMIAITAVALALAVAYKHVTEKAEAAAAAKKAAKERSKELREEYGKLENSLYSIALEWAVYNETLTETEAEERRAAKAITQSFLPTMERKTEELEKANAAQERQVNFIKTLMEIRDKELAGLERSGMGVDQLARRKEYLNSVIEEEREELKGLMKTQRDADDALKTSERQLQSVIDKKQIMIRASAEEADANTETAGTVDMVADAYKFLAEKMTAALLASGGMAETIKDLTDRAIGPNQSASEQLTMKYADMARAMVALKEESERRIEVLKAEIEEAKVNEVTTEALTEAEEALANEMKNASDAGEGLVVIAGALRIAQEDLAYSLADTSGVIEGDLGPGIKKLTDDMEDMLVVLDSAGKMSTVFGNVFSSAIELSMMQSDKLTEKQREQLWVLYEMQKAAAMTSITIDTASAIVSAYAWAGPLYPIAAAAIAAGGAMQLGIVSATPPPFHVGGIVPDGSGLVAALPGEAFLNRQATANLGADGVAALNSGGGAGGMVIQNVYGHRVFDRFVIDNISKGGPLNSAIKGNTRVGHRKRSTV